MKKMTKFAQRITSRSGIGQLMEDLGSAMEVRPEIMMLGGGVCDAYQPVEEKYKLARKILELMDKYNYPVHVLTKSVLIERDLDILERIRNRNPVIVSFSFSSADEKISGIFEPGVPSPAKRLELIRKLKSKGFYCGMFLMPVIPFITDTPEMMDNTLRQAKEAGIDFVIFGEMTLKQGRQQAYFMNMLSRYFPELVGKYKELYKFNMNYGQPLFNYLKQTSHRFDQLAAEHQIPKRIPPGIFKQVLNKSDQVIVFLEQLDYLLRLKGQKSPYGYAAYMISKLNKPVDEILFETEKIKGVGPATIKIIKEILETGTCRYYESLL